MSGSKVGMAKRKKLSKKVRFEVLKRDKFTCQYCGAKAPDVLLHVDHVRPVAGGGGNELLNLIASCEPCNLGKSDRKLSDTSAVTVAHKQAASLQERREQIEMMAKWQSSLVDLDTEQLRLAHEVIKQLMPGRELSESSIVELRKHLKQYGIEMVLSQFRSSFGQHVRASTAADYVDSLGRAINHAMSALKWKEYNERDPIGSKARYIRAIVRNRCTYINERDALDYVRQAISAGISYDDLLDMAKRCVSWSQWENAIIGRILGGV